MIPTPSIYEDSRSSIHWYLRHYLAAKKACLKAGFIFFCTTLGRLRWSFWKYDVTSVFFNVCIVSKSPAEFSPRIGAFMELCSNANLSCLVNMALCFL